MEYRTFMKRLTKVVRSGHGGRMGSTSGKEDPVITDRLRAEDFVFTKVCKRTSIIVANEQLSTGC